MKDQVTSIEQSKRLIELGVPAEKASMCWVKDPNENEYYLAVHDEYCYEVACLEPVPAFTVADLLGLLPAEITYGSLYVSHPKIPSIKNDFNVFYKRVGREKGAIKSFRSPNLTSACAMMVEWLLSNGYKLNL